MKRRVAHFDRVFLSPYATFVGYQITTLRRYDPMVIAKVSIPNNDFKIGNIYFFEQALKGFAKIKARTLYALSKMVLTRQEKEYIVEFLYRQKADILHFHFGASAIYYLPVIKAMTTPTIVSFYGFDCSAFPKRLLGLTRKLLVSVFKQVDCILAMTKEMKEDLMKLGCPEEKIKIHYYGVDIDRFYLAQKTYDKESEITILQVARLTPIKGHIYLLQSIENILKQQQRYSIIVRLVGDGPLMKPLIAYVRKRGFSKRIVFLGRVEYSDERLVEEYKKADIFVHPSVTTADGRKEGVPGTIVEAMSSGLPIVSTYHAGIPSVIENGSTGLLVGEKDVTALTRAIMMLIEDVQLRQKLGRKAQEFAFENLNMHSKTEELERIYDSLISAKLR